MIENIIGNKMNIRILRFLYFSPNRYFSFLEIERFVGAGRAGIVSALQKLEYYGLVYTEKKGGKRYKLRLDHPIIEKLDALFSYEKKFLQGIDPKKLNIIANIENDCIKRIPELQEIRVFGSIAKGKAHEKSDIDLFILVKKNSPLVKTTMEEIKEKYEQKYKVQTIIMDKEEFGKRKKEPLVQEIIKTGINVVPA